MAAGGVPIAAGENLRSLWEFKNYISVAPFLYPEPDVTQLRWCHSLYEDRAPAEAFNLPVTSHGAHDVTVGFFVGRYRDCRQVEFLLFCVALA